MSSKYSNKLKARIQKDYVENGMSVDDIHDLYGNPSKRTIVRWATDGKWNELRENYSKSKESVEQKAIKLIDKKLDHLLDIAIEDVSLGEIDAVAKLNALRKTFSKQLPIDEALVIIQPVLVEFIKEYIEKNPNKKEHLSELFKGKDCFWSLFSKYIWSIKE